MRNAKQDEVAVDSSNSFIHALDNYYNGEFKIRMLMYMNGGRFTIKKIDNDDFS